MRGPQCERMSSNVLPDVEKIAAPKLDAGRYRRSASTLGGCIRLSEQIATPRLPKLLRHARPSVRAHELERIARCRENCRAETRCGQISSLCVNSRRMHTFERTDCNTTLTKASEACAALSASA